MKTCLIFFAVLGLSYGYTLPEETSRGLSHDMEDIFALIPSEKIRKIIAEYAANDKEVQAMQDFMKSQEFEEILHKIADVPEVREFIHYLEGKGFDVVEFLNKIGYVFGIRDNTNRTSTSKHGWSDMFLEISLVIPVEKLIVVLKEKMETSKDFAEVYQKIADSHEIFMEIAAFPEVAELINRLRDIGMDIDAVFDFIHTVFGWHHHHYSARGLSQDVEELFSLIPTEEIREIVKVYMANDREVQAIAEYLISDKFEKIVFKVAAVPEIKEFVDYLEGKGLKIIDFLNKIADILGFPQISNKYSQSVSTRGWRNMFTEIKARIPLGKFITIFYAKLANSKDFAEVFQKLAESQAVFDEISGFPEIIEFNNHLRELGVDVDAFVDFIMSFFGWE